MDIVRKSRFSTKHVVELCRVAITKPVKSYRDKDRKCFITVFDAKPGTIGNRVYLLEYDNGHASVRIE